LWIGIAPPSESLTPLAEESARATIALPLQHARIADVLPVLSTVLSPEREIVTNYETNTITITDERTIAETAQRLAAALDQPAVPLRLEFSTWQIIDSERAARTLISGEIARFQQEGYQRQQKLALDYSSGRRMQTTLENRWRITCLITPAEDGVAFVVHDLIVFDLQEEIIVARLRQQTIQQNTELIISETIVHQGGEPIVITFTTEIQD